MADYTINAKNKRFGRVASDIALILQGKRNPDYDPKNPGKDRVLLEHYEKLEVTGRKMKEKLYHRHTGYMGHLKTRTFEDAFTRNPKAVIRDAVRRMLPKNFLNARRLNNLIFVEHARQ